MAVMAVALVLGCAGGWATGGRIANMGSLRIRAWPVLLAGAVLEVPLGLVPGSFRAVLAVAACVAVVTWCVVNAAGARRLPSGQALIALGVGLNATVMAFNSGMPVSAPALAAAGMRSTMDVARGHLYKHTAMTAHTHLRWLGDVVPLRLARTVLSPGDILMLAGIVIVTWAAMQPGRRRDVRLAKLASRTLG